MAYSRPVSLVSLEPLGWIVLCNRIPLFEEQVRIGYKSG